MSSLSLSNTHLLAIVDHDDFARASKYNWTQNKNGYVYTVVGREIWFLHRFILNLFPGDKEKVDHKFGDKLDNRKSQLRIATTQQNSANKKSTLHTSQYKGVSWYNRNQKWAAHIKVNTKGINLGYFEQEIDAAKTYDIAALQYFGEFAKTNFCHV